MKTSPIEHDLPNIRHMLLFCHALKSGSISLAADRMFLTQPAASQGIARLEVDLGAPLLIRGGKGITPTEQGEIFFARADRAIEFLKSGLKAALHHAGQDVKKVEQLHRNITAAQLRTLIAMGRHGSFTVAAKSLGLAQPTVHRTAKALEDTCGFTMFRSTVGGIELTAPGQVLNQSAKLARAELRQAREELTLFSGLGRRTFVLGSLPLARSQIVPDAILNMLDREKDLQVRVIEGRYAELLRALREGDIDCLIGALRNPAPADDVVEKRLFGDDLIVVASANHPLAKLETLTLEDTLEYPWIAPPISTPAGQYLFETLEIENKSATPVRVVASSFILLKELLMNGEFLTVISELQVSRELETGHLKALPINLEGQTRQIGLTIRKKWHPTASQQAFLEELGSASERAIAAVK